MMTVDEIREAIASAEHSAAYWREQLKLHPDYRGAEVLEQQAEGGRS